MGKVRRDFTREFKIEAVRLSHQTDKTLDEFGEDMNISRRQRIPIIPCLLHLIYSNKTF